MKRLINKSIALLGITGLFLACSMELHVLEPSFEVRGYEVEKAIDTLDNEIFQVSFQLSGDPDIISFYSGQVENDYQYRDGRLLDYDALNLSFDSRVNASGTQDNLSVHVSTNFNGDYTFESVTGADWTDITGLFTWATGATWTDSKIQDIIQYREEGKPLYIAFKYTYYPNPPAGTARLWRINPFKLSAVTMLGEVEIGGQTTSGWKFVSNAIDDDPITRSRIEGSAQGRVSNIMFQYGNTINTEIGHETWCISTGFDLDVIDNGPDRAIPIKRIIDPPLSIYRYNYATPGTYEVVFVAKNVTGTEEKQVIKTIQISIP